MTRPGKLPLGILLFALALAAFKAYTLSMEIAGSMADFGRLVALDFSFLAFMAMLAILHCRARLAWLRLPVMLVLGLSLAFYLVHSFVLLELDESMSLFDVGRYLPEGMVILSFFNALTVGAITLFVISLFIRLRCSHRLSGWLGVIALVALVTGVVVEREAPYELRKYGLLKTGSLAGGMLNRQPASVYSPEQIARYSSGPPEPVVFVEPEPDIILLIVESLSSINSLKVSGERNLLPAFDRMAGDGVLFTNFFANHSASEGGIISLLSGFPPLHFPTATPLMFDEFATQPSVVSEYRRAGYFTEFLTNADLAFIGLDRYITGLELDLARGRDEVPELQQAPRFVQDAPSDRLLYAEALARVDQQADSPRPWLMAVATVSTHLPYTHPEGGEDTAQAVWDWSLERMLAFYAGLESRGFFDNGLLLITGDHRQMRPLSRQETSRFGDSAKARIPLLIIGNGFPAGTFDERFFQQSDLLRKLGLTKDPGQSLSPNPIWVERYNRIYGKVESINRFSVFDPSNLGLREFPARISGTELTWLEARPSNARVIESRVHAQRALHQFNRSGGLPGCQPFRVEEGWSPSSENGLGLQVLVGEDINVTPEPGASFQPVESINPVAADIGVARESLRYVAYLEVDQPGVYWFRTSPGTRTCLAVNGQMVIDQLGAGNGSQGSIELEKGLHGIDLRITRHASGMPLALEWVTPGLTRWRWREVPSGRLYLPR